MDIEQLKQKILDLAIRGQLVPQDPNDESASVLIEKIRREKEELVKKGKIKASKNDSYIYKGADNCYYEKKGDNIVKIEVPFVIPENWCWCRLGAIFDIGSSKRIHKSDWQQSGVPFYRARDIELLNSDIFKSDIYISKLLYEDIKNKYGIPSIGDVLVSAVGTLGKTYVIKDNNPFYFKDGNIIILKNIFHINPHYIQMLFESFFLMNQIKEDSKGTTVDTFTIEHAKETLVPLPSIAMQDLIVEKYKRVKVLINEIKTEKSSLESLITKCKNEVLNYFFEENSSYKSYYEGINSLEKLISKNKIGDGDWVLSENMSDNGPFSIVQLKHIGFGKYIGEKTYNHVPLKFVKENNCSVLKSNYLLINRLIADTMKVCLLPQLEFDTITSVDVCWIAQDSKYSQEYLMYLLLSPSFQKHVLINSSGSTRKRISKKNLLKIPIKVHDRETQDKIVFKIKSAFLILDKIIQ